MDVTDKDFKENVLEQSKDIPVVADFWASWCMPCQMLGPVLEKIEKDYAGKIILAKINVDDAKEAATEYGIMSIPSVKMFRDGHVVDEFMGSIPEEKIREWIDKNI